ncbi:T9SS type B sorting domain-containing protein [Lacinutrix sp. Hel_I_90]|uniref:T9SS type B sorting domain-containing protein n=1 Tax=Lacinutrix sp. Hel_I_90 TaxID=1249999 RepID=UPI0005CAFCA6|nr:T9SS type B sorting domain-containing protein [Lacinutrix sp. Hel_I_90]
MKQALIFLLFLTLSVGFAQNETNIWYFGVNAGLDFNSGAPVPLLDGELNTDEGCATISNASGNLLFYTDGVTVWNNTHAVMLNGTGLNGDFSSTHSALIVPKPNDPNVYYIFTVDAQAGADGLQYSEVDMTLDGGLGGVTSNKNILLITPTTEKLTAIKNPIANEYWVISHKWESDEFVAYNVSDIGINMIPVISASGTYVDGDDFATIGQIKVSPDGTKLAVARREISEVQVFDFDATSGVVSNPLTVLNVNITDEFVYGVEFSPNSKRLYASITGIGVYQYDLEAGSVGAIIASQILVSPQAHPYSALQLASDGKIYVAKSSRFYIDYIDNPNALGAACNYQFEGLYLNGKQSKRGLPPFIQSFLQIDDVQFENVCNGDTTQFSLSNTVDAAVWNFGNSASGTNNTATGLNPTHVFTGAGTYDVSVTVTVGTQTATSTATVTIYEQPTATQPQDLLICDNNNDGLYTFNLTNQDIAILNGQSNTDFEVLYYSSATDYTNENPITNPLAYTNTTAYANQTIIVSVRNINNPDCEASTSFNIQVFDSATPNQNVTALEFCDNTSFGTDTDGIILFDLTQNETAILNGQSASAFTVSYYTDAALMNQITNPSNYQNTNTSETIYMQVVNNNNMLCEAQTAFNIEVFALPVVNPTALLSQCDDDLDGFSAFNLNEVVNEITTNAVSETITFHETLAEAENSINTITNTTTYSNQLVSADVVFARIENTNGCFRTAQINLFVSTTQIPLTFTRDFYACDDGIDGYDGVATFDFSTVNTEIQALFPVGQQLIINYYRNQADALAENDPILDISNYSNIGYPNTQDIFIRVDSAVNNDCLGLGQHITLHVEAMPFATGPIIIQQCDIGNDGTEEIDTSTINAELLQGQTDVSIVFTDANGTVLSNPLPNPLVTGTQSITATMTNTTSLDLDGACSVWTTIDIIVDPGVIANAVPDFNVCDDNNDGQFAFDTSGVASTILNGQTGAEVSYRDGSGTVLSSPLPNPFVTNTQTITATVINPLNPLCFAETAINFIVNPQPIANTVQDAIVCDDVSNDGEHVFNLSDYNIDVLNGQLNTVFNISYHGSQMDADLNASPLPNAYLSTVTSETIYVRIENNNNTTCFDTTSFQIGVSYSPTAMQPENISLCDDSTNDGFEIFDLSIQNTTILNGQSSTENVITYHLSQVDAEANINALNPSYTNISNAQTIYARVENINNSNCFATTSFELIVNEQPVLNMSDQWTICANESVEIIADEGYDNYFWATGETTRIITVENPGTYTVTASNTYGGLICETSKTVSVIESSIAIIADIETIDWTQNDNAIIVNVEGDGDYEYSIDGFNYQDSNQFTNLSIDDYTVYVRDKNGCGISEEEVYLLYYPSYFTPNGDGVHETWQIFNSDKEPNNVTYIYDRYGKLLTQINPGGNGWDGTFNGNPLPTSDYWFVVNRQNGKQYRGHFTLKR